MYAIRSYYGKSDVFLDEALGIRRQETLRMPRERRPFPERSPSQNQRDGANAAVRDHHVGWHDRNAVLRPAEGKECLRNRALKHDVRAYACEAIRRLDPLAREPGVAQQ